MHNQSDNSYFLSSLETNMLSVKAISKIPEYIVSKKGSSTSANNANNSKKNIISNTNNIFSPSQKDQLFWIFYSILHGVDEYEMTHNFFTKEKEVKFKWVENFRERKELFKPIKVSRNAVEDELTNKPKISLQAIKALCYFYNINIFYIDNKKFYEMITDENKCVYIIEKTNHKYGLTRDVTKESLDYYRENYWKLENLDKPLKALSSYKVSDLVNICKKLNIVCDNLTKQKMYQEIMRVL